MCIAYAKPFRILSKFEADVRAWQQQQQQTQWKMVKATIEKFD